MTLRYPPLKSRIRKFSECFLFALGVIASAESQCLAASDGFPQRVLSCDVSRGRVDPNDSGLLYFDSSADDYQRRFRLSPTCKSSEAPLAFELTESLQAKEVSFDVLYRAERLDDGKAGLSSCLTLTGRYSSEQLSSSSARCELGLPGHPDLTIELRINKQSGNEHLEYAITCKIVEPASDELEPPGGGCQGTRR